MSVTHTQKKIIMKNSIHSSDFETVTFPLRIIKVCLISIKVGGFWRYLLEVSILQSITSSDKFVISSRNMDTRPI